MNEIIRNGKVYTNRSINVPLIATQASSYEDPLSPNVYYKFGELSEFYLDIEEGNNPNIVNEYMFEFRSGSTATDFSYNSESITVIDSEFAPEAGKTYIGSIVNGLCIIVGV